MNEARARSRASWVGSGEAATEAQWYALRDEIGATEFLGYDTEVAEGVIQAIMRGDERVTEAAAGDEVGIVVNQTPFYAELGGQIGDTGAIFSPNGGDLAVRDTVKKAGELHLHLGTVRHGTLRVGDAVELRVESGRRRQLRANHSVTHLLHQALRHRLGEHVTQKGSLVAPDRLRFDFSHPEAIDARGHRGGRGRGQRPHPRQRRSAHPPVDPRTRRRRRARWRCSARSTARRCGSSRWARPTIRRGPIRSSCAAARMSGAPAISDLQDRRRERDRLRRAPHRGADRRRGRGLRRRRGGAAAAGRLGAAHQPGRAAGAAVAARRGKPPDRARAGRGAAGAGDGRCGGRAREWRRGGAGGKTDRRYRLRGAAGRGRTRAASCAGWPTI